MSWPELVELGAAGRTALGEPASSVLDQLLAVERDRVANEVALLVVQLAETPADVRELAPGELSRAQLLELLEAQRVAYVGVLGAMVR